MRREENYPSYYFKDSAETDSAALQRSAGEPLRDMHLYGNTVQDTGRTKNIVPYPLMIKQNQEVNGITLTFNEDCTITINGTATSNYSYKLTNALQLDENKIYTFSSTDFYELGYLYYRMIQADGTVKWLNANTVHEDTGYRYIPIDLSSYPDSTNSGLYLYFRANATFDNVTISIQFEEGNAPTEHEPFAKYIYPDSPAEMHSVGDENSLNLSKVYWDAYTRNGVTWIIDETGKVTAKGTASENALCWVSTTFRLSVGDTILFRIEPDLNIKWSVVIGDERGINAGRIGETIYNSLGENKYTETNPKTAFCAVILFVPNGKTVDYEGYPIIVKDDGSGSIDEIMAKYGYKIPIEVSNDSTTHSTDIYLKEPLRSIGEYSDELDLGGGRVLRRIYPYKVTGDERWRAYADGKNGVYTTFYLYLTNTTLPAPIANGTTHINAYCDMLSGITRSYMYEFGIPGVSASNDNTNEYIRVCMVQVTTLEEFAEAFLSKHPTIYYVLDEPIIEELALPKVATPKTDCTFKVKTALSPSKTELQYYKW